MDRVLEGYPLLGGRIFVTGNVAPLAGLYAAGYSCLSSVDPDELFAEPPRWRLPPSPGDFVVPYGATPLLDQTTRFCAVLSAWLLNGEKVVVHSFYGMERTGLMVAAFLLSSGAATSPEEAISIITRAAADPRAAPTRP